jgi:Tfp pilus assembly protein PilF
VEARTAFSAALKINPAFNTAALSLADLDLAEGKLEPARTRVQSLLTRGDRSIDVLLKAAQIEAAARRDTEAQSYYEQVILRDPNNIEALNNLAYSLANGGKDPDRALVLAQKVKELAPYSSAIDDTIGWAYYHKGLYPIAARYIAKSSDAFAIRNYHLAMTHFKLGNREQAAGFLRVAMAQDPSLPEATIAAHLMK